MSHVAWCFWMLIGAGGMFGVVVGSFGDTASLAGFGVFAVMTLVSFRMVQIHDDREPWRRHGHDKPPG